MSGSTAHRRHASDDHARPLARAGPRKRSLSPDALDHRPTRRKRSGSPAPRHKPASRRHASRSRSRSAPANGRPGRARSRSRDVHSRRDRSGSTSRRPDQRNRGSGWSRELTRRRRPSASRSASPPPPPPPRRRRRSHSRSASPPRRQRRAHSDSRSPPPPRRRRRENEGDDRSRSPPLRSRKPLPSQLDSYRADPTTDVAPPAPKEKINWKTTGALAAEANSVQVSVGEKVVLKYNEPPDARKPPPSAQWRLYIFKGEQSVGGAVQLSAQSCWLVGREERVADLPVAHPSCSKQHAVIQFRFVPKRQEKQEMGVDDFLAEFGEPSVGGGGGAAKEKGKVRPYLLDLESANGTTLNGEEVEPKRFVELREKDVIKFGLSEREYVLLKE